MVDHLKEVKDSGGLQGKDVIELGCGQGLPGIICKMGENGAKEVVLQDYNQEVISDATEKCVKINLSQDQQKQVKFLAGSWENLKS